MRTHKEYVTCDVCGNYKEFEGEGYPENWNPIFVTYRKWSNVTQDVDICDKCLPKVQSIIPTLFIK